MKINYKETVNPIESVVTDNPLGYSGHRLMISRNSDFLHTPLQDDQVVLNIVYKNGATKAVDQCIRVSLRELKATVAKAEEIG